jgi:hypothetical protein
MAGASSINRESHRLAKGSTAKLSAATFAITAPVTRRSRNHTSTQVSAPRTAPTGRSRSTSSSRSAWIPKAFCTPASNRK